MKLVHPVCREACFEVSEAVEPDLPQALRPVGGTRERRKKSFRAPGTVITLQNHGREIREGRGCFPAAGEYNRLDVYGGGG